MRKKSYFHILLALAIFPHLVGCSNASHKAAVENERKNIIEAELANKRKTNAGMFDIQSVELLTYKSQPIYTIAKSFMELPKTGANNSQINTMYDGFGNKTEMRCFANDPAIKCVLLKTSATNRKQVIVFGNNGEIKRLPDELADKAMTADASYIAATVGIFAVPKIVLIPNMPTANEEAEAFNKPSPTPITTAEIPAEIPNDLTTQTAKPKETPDVKLPENKKDSPPQIKVDSLWLNNFPVKKKTPQP